MSISYKLNKDHFLCTDVKWGSESEKSSIFFSMNDDVLISIKQYCTDHGCPKTAKKIKIESVSESPKLEDVFKDLDIGKKRKIKVIL